jgi:hypothetical protein
VQEDRSARFELLTVPERRGAAHISLRCPECREELAQPAETNVPQSALLSW